MRHILFVYHTNFNIAISFHGIWAQANAYTHSLTFSLSVAVCAKLSLCFVFSLSLCCCVYMVKRSCVCWGIQSSTAHTRTHTHAKVNTYHLMLLNALLRFFRSFSFIFFVVPFILLIHLFFV